MVIREVNQLGFPILESEGVVYVPLIFSQWSVIVSDIRESETRLYIPIRRKFRGEMVISHTLAGWGAGWSGVHFDETGFASIPDHSIHRRPLLLSDLTHHYTDPADLAIIFDDGEVSNREIMMESIFDSFNRYDRRPDGSPIV